MRLKKFEIRMSVSKNLYERISQEARYRDTKMANIAREKLAKHFFQHEISANKHVALGIQQKDQLNENLQLQLARTEKKLFSGISKTEKTIRVSPRTNEICYNNS